MISAFCYQKCEKKTIKCQIAYPKRQKKKVEILKYNQKKQNKQNKITWKITFKSKNPK